MRAELETTPYCVDHIIAIKHRGPTIEPNLALACYNCNSFKGDNLSGLDPQTEKLTRLFHPRRDQWPRHFRWDGPHLVGRTAVGRTTTEVLKINSWERVEWRRALLKSGAFTTS
jgi:hypothetical protein